MIYFETIFDSDREEYEFMQEKKEQQMKEQIDKKAIEEMAKVLERVCDKIVCSDYHMNCELCQATCLYNAGYRKQSEGEWIRDSHYEESYCSICGGISPVDCEKELFYESNFCPNCGAKMKGGAE